MKKLFLFLIALSLLLSSFSLFSFAVAASPVVYVTIVKQFEENKDFDKFATEQLAVSVVDADSDGSLTVNDALILAHGQVYDGGASAGYAYSSADGNLKIDKLWGTSDASYGCYLNHAAVSPSASISHGDYLVATVLTADKQDVYAYFDLDVATAVAGKPFMLTLKTVSVSENQVVVLPLADATILIDDVVTEFKTDAEGKAEIVCSREGRHVVSALSYTQPIVPPICVVTASPAVPGDLPEDTTETTSPSGGTSNVELPELKFDGDDASDAGCKNGCGGVVSAPVAIIALLGTALLTVRRKDD